MGFLYHLSSPFLIVISLHEKLITLNIHMPNSCQESHYLLSYCNISSGLLLSIQSAAAKAGGLPGVKQVPSMDRNRVKQDFISLGIYPPSWNVHWRLFHLPCVLCLLDQGESMLFQAQECKEPSGHGPQAAPGQPRLGCRAAWQRAHTVLSSCRDRDLSVCLSAGKEGDIPQADQTRVY